MQDIEVAFQDQLQKNHCFGCGADNDQGLKIKSYWADDGTAVCRFTAKPHHCAGPTRYLNGGIMATLLDCHSICSAIALAYRTEGRAISEGESIAFVTGSMDIAYKQPVPIDSPVLLKAELESLSSRKTRVVCRLFSEDNLCAQADVLAVRVPDNW